MQKKTPGDSNNSPKHLSKSSSTNSLFITGTISKPNMEIINMAISILLHTRISTDIKLRSQLLANPPSKIFSEEMYMEERPETFTEDRIEMLRSPPSKEDIFDFLHELYLCSKSSPECCILCLIYITRIQCLTGIPLHISNWRPLVLCGISIAHKVYDDKHLSNASIVTLYPFFSKPELDQMIMKFLELIQYPSTLKYRYTIDVKTTTYAKFYYELLELKKFNKMEKRMIRPLKGAEENELELSHTRFKGLQMKNEYKEI